MIPVESFNPLKYDQSPLIYSISADEVDTMTRSWSGHREPPEPDPVCQILGLSILGAEKPSTPYQELKSIRCKLNNKGQLEIGSPVWEELLGSETAKTNAVLVTRIGKGIVISYHPSSEAKGEINASSALCTDNSPLAQAITHGIWQWTEPPLFDGAAAREYCYHASETMEFPVDLTFTNNAGQQIEIQTIQNNNPNILIFGSTGLTESGTTTIRSNDGIHAEEVTAGQAYSTLAALLKDMFGEDTVVVYATGVQVNLPFVDSIPEPIQPTSLAPDITSIATPYVETSSSTLPYSPPTETASIEPIRPVIGTRIMADLICNTACNIKITTIDPQNPTTQDLINKLKTDSHSPMIKEATNALTKKQSTFTKIKKSLSQFFNQYSKAVYEEYRSPAIEIDTSSGVNIAGLEILNQSIEKGIITIYAQRGELFYIQAPVDEWLKHTSSKVVDQNGTIDQIGTTQYNLANSNLAIPDNPLYVYDKTQDIFYFPPNSITSTMEVADLEYASDRLALEQKFITAYVIDDQGNVVISDKVPANIHGSNDRGRITIENGKIILWMAPDTSIYTGLPYTTTEVGIPIGEMATP